MKYTKEMNDGKHVFVFGSNTRGIHGAGAALEARKNWGARIGCGIGRTGDAYAIPTKGHRMEVLPLDRIKGAVITFIDYAEANSKLTFLVTAIGCGLAGYSPSQIAPMFKDAPSNCVLPDEFKSLKYTSNARWPRMDAHLGNSEITTDTHDTYDQAKAVCEMLERDGWGGGGKMFPVKTWVEAKP